MENASKALVIAGGILLALMTLSLLVYMTTATSRIAQAQDEKVASEQLVAFNMEYEAYNKRRMYGVDVITVVNKAINYNGGLHPEDTNDFINIRLIIPEGTDFTSSIQTITTNLNGEIIKEKTKVDEDASLGAGKYELQEVTGTIKMDEDMINFFNQPVEDPAPEIEGTTTKYTYSALTNFKRAIFECTKCDDTNSDGRIDLMEFTQYKSYMEY